MVIAIKKQGETEDRLIARFKKMVLDSGLIQEARDRARYKTPGEKKKEKRARIKHLIALEKKRNR
jgi:ribosomal protein S21